jgi:hypothetical protein
MATAPDRVVRGRLSLVRLTLLVTSAESALLGDRSRRRRQLVGLVDEGSGDLTELLAVLAGVVGAEEELAPGLQLHAQVGLGAATVAAIRRGQR